MLFAQAASAKCITYYQLTRMHQGSVAVVLNAYVMPPVLYMPMSHLPEGDTMLLAVDFAWGDPCGDRYVVHTVNGDTVSAAWGYTCSIIMHQTGVHRITARWEIVDTVNWSPDLDLTLTIDPPNADPLRSYLSLSARLGGVLADANGHMRDDLRTAGLIPLTEPYSALGFAMVGGQGTMVAADLLADQASWTSNVVDWVLIDFRSAIDPAVIIATRVCLLTRVGGIMPVDPVTQLPYGSYYIAVRHRNHMSAMTSLPVQFDGVSRYANLTYSATNCFGTAGVSEAAHGLWPGNARIVSGTQQVKYAGLSNDRDAILQRLGGSEPNAVVQGYFPEDLNLDGYVKYTGFNNDRDIVLQTIGGAVPTAVRSEQMP